MTASAAWFRNREEADLADLVAGFTPDQQLRLAVATRADLGFGLLARTLLDSYTHDPLPVGEWREVLRKLVDERRRELTGNTRGPRRAGERQNLSTRHGSAELVYGSWMCRVVPDRGWHHADDCVCGRCSPPPEDDTWIHDALYEGLDREAS